jgi:hypothetical protein
VPTDRAGPDSDLQAIRGVGPKIEAQLKAAGITSLEQLARTSLNELVTLLRDVRPRYDADRIIREGWLAQAARLAATEHVPADTGRYRHNFTAEVHLEVGSDDVISSKVVHVQTGDEDAWAGWDADRLVRFIEERAGVAEPTPACVPGEQLALCSYAIVDAPVMAKPRAGVLSSYTAMVTIPTSALALDLAGPRAAIDVFARRRGAQKSAPLGHAEVAVELSVLTEIGLSCRLSPIGPDEAVFATVRVFAAPRPTEQMAHQLPGVRMEILAS